MHTHSCVNLPGDLFLFQKTEAILLWKVGEIFSWFYATGQKWMMQA